MEAIVNGIASMLWATEWANHAEEHGCCSLSGVNVYDVMPEVPQAALDLAWRLVGKLEQANGVHIAVIYSRAMAAIGKVHPKPADGSIGNEEWVYETKREQYYADYADCERFGECLAHMAVGAGVSWFDDHAEFALVVPHIEGYGLRYLADTGCEHGE